jgi:hypothetical protein
MSQNKNQLELPPIPGHPEAVVSHDVHENTLGALAVQYANEAVAFDMHVEEVDQVKTRAAELQAIKRQPDHVGAIRRKIGQRTGSVMSDEEFIFVNDVANMGSRATWHRESAAEKRQRALGEITNVRKRVGDFDEDQSKTFEMYMAENVPAFFRRKKAEFGDDTWATYFTEKAEDQDVLDFLHMHNDKLERQRHSPEVAALINNEKATFSEAKSRGVYEGWLNEDALHTDEVDIRLADTFETLIDERAVGYHNKGDNVVVLMGDWNKDLTKTITTLLAKHELSHGTFDGFEELWMEEAGAELVAARMDDRESIDYKHTIKLVKYIVGSDQASLDLFTRAYSQKADTGEATGDRKALIKHINNRLGEGRFRAVHEAWSRDWFVRKMHPEKYSHPVEQASARILTELQQADGK